MIYHVTVGDRVHTVEVTGDEVRVDGRSMPVRISGTDGARTVCAGDRHRPLLASRLPGGRWRIDLDGSAWTARVQDERARAIEEMTQAAASARGPDPVRAPMPGLIVRVAVQPGDTVEAGQAVAIVEAMKMENELRAPAPAIVRAVHVGAGDTVDKDQVLVELERPEADEGAA